jgi:hypothetical protein
VATVAEKVTMAGEQSVAVVMMALLALGDCVTCGGVCVSGNQVAPEHRDLGVPALVPVRVVCVAPVGRIDDDVMATVIFAAEHRAEALHNRHACEMKDSQWASFDSTSTTTHALAALDVIHNNISFGGLTLHVFFVFLEIDRQTPRNGAGERELDPSAGGKVNLVGAW